MGRSTAIAAGIGLLIIGRLLYVNKAIDIMARTAWGEARGEGPEGMRAVCHVIMNRANKGGWWGSSVVQVAQKPWQFSAWNENDPNRAKLQAVNDNDPEFRQALEIAEAVYNGELEDSTDGATHYHANWMRPAWADDALISAQIGQHTFYKDIA